MALVTIDTDKADKWFRHMWDHAQKTVGMGVKPIGPFDWNILGPDAAPIPDEPVAVIISARRV